MLTVQEAQHALTTVVESGGHHDTVKSIVSTLSNLLERKANLNYANLNWGRETPLTYVCGIVGHDDEGYTDSDIKMLRALLTVKASTTQPNKAGKTPLMMAAAENGGTLAINILLEAGAQPDYIPRIPNFIGRPASFYAAQNRQLESLVTLVTHADAKDDSLLYKTLQYVICSRNVMSCYTLLYALGDKLPSVGEQMSALSTNPPEKITQDYTLEFRTNLRLKRLLNWADPRNDFVTLLMLMTWKLWPCVKSPRNYPFLLMDKELESYCSILWLLLKLGVDPSAEDRYGSTALDGMRFIYPEGNVEALLGSELHDWLSCVPQTE